MTKLYKGETMSSIKQITEDIKRLKGVLSEGFFSNLSSVLQEIDSAWESLTDYTKETAKMLHNNHVGSSGAVRQARDIIESGRELLIHSGVKKSEIDGLLKTIGKMDDAAEDYAENLKVCSDKLKEIHDNLTDIYTEKSSKPEKSAEPGTEE
jgi:DNA repair ATPase RecN